MDTCCTQLTVIIITTHLRINFSVFISCHIVKSMELNPTLLNIRVYIDDNFKSSFLTQVYTTICISLNKTKYNIPYFLLP
jgi:hypothetical protein